MYDKLRFHFYSCLSVGFCFVLQPQHHPPTPVDGNIDSDDQIEYVSAFCSCVRSLDCLNWCLIDDFYVDGNGSFPPGSRSKDGPSRGLRSLAT